MNQSPSNRMVGAGGGGTPQMDLKMKQTLKDENQNMNCMAARKAVPTGVSNSDATVLELNN